MSKKPYILAVIALVSMLFAALWVFWGKPKQVGGNHVIDGVAKRHVATASKVAEPNQVPEDNRNGGDNVIDPILVIEDFDIRFRDLRTKTGEAWVSGLRELATISNRLETRPGYQPFTASALMVTRLSDLAISRLMAGEVSPEETIVGLGHFTYKGPDDQRLVDFICEFNPDARAVREANPSEAISGFLVRLEPEMIIPDTGWSPDKTGTGILTKPTAYALALVMGSAEMRLQSAIITATYLKNGGDPRFTGSDLETDLAARTGALIANFPRPLFGDGKPAAASVAFFIEHARLMYPRAKHESD